MQHNLAMIQTSAQRLSTLVNDILDYSKMSHGELNLNLETVNLASVAHLVLTPLFPLAQHKGLELENKLPETLYVRADSNRLQQILYNLLGNAIKYTEQGGVRITARSKDGTVFVEVSDTGIGIPDDKFDDIFESFEQLDRSVRRLHEGTGLGLSITKELVALHHGTISVDSTPDEGSCFTFTLPGATPSSEVTHLHVAQRQQTTQCEKSAEVTFAPDAYKILVVDNDSVNTHVVMNYLELEEWHGVEAHSGQEALDFLDTDTFDLVLLDLMMPRMSGFEVCRIIRQTYDRDKLPVIMLTVRDNVEDLVAGFEAGANDYLRKPFVGAELIARIQAEVQRARFGQELRQLKEGVQLGTDFVRHVLKGYTGSLNLFTSKVAQYAEEHQLDTLFADAQRMIRRSQDLVALIDRIKTLTAEVHVIPRHLDMMATLESVLKEQKPMLIQNKIEFYTEYAPPSMIVDHDTVHVSEVLRNLIQNAVEAMENQPIRKLRFRVLQSGRWSRVEMEDTGMGVSSTNVSTIFEKYFTTKKSTDHNFGLGLYYCAKVMEKHGGRIEVESGSSGTTIILSFPNVWREQP